MKELVRKYKWFNQSSLRKFLKLERGIQYILDKLRKEKKEITVKLVKMLRVFYKIESDNNIN